ncbi:hypothetical protein HGA92_00875 [Candidatus Gracilibacteria bacterium]|nr:hypothetical protein [Candidatus Gracilibacteria bacterium]NUJ98837.1 hypothetical protein [Candidatus Gracilibacteria bacterium]
MQDYDYSSGGAYFITICTKNRENYFGEIADGAMVLNEWGKIVFDGIKNIENYNEFSSVDEFVVMPNHLHLIIMVSYRRDNSGIVSTEQNVGIVSTTTMKTAENRNNRRNMLIPKIVGKFKMITAKQINILKNSVGNKLWQSNYYDRIIRNEDELQRIRKYIIENPLKWEFDKNNTENLFM